MSKGGFLVKFDGKKSDRCYLASFDYDKWEYTVNGSKTKHLPPKLKNISIKPENTGRRSKGRG